MATSTYDPTTGTHYHTERYAAVDVAPLTVRRTSWGAIFAGAVVALVIQLLLTLLGLAIGSQAVDPAQEADPLSGLGIGAGIWWVVSGIISLFAGGWVAGRLAGFPRALIGGLHGLVVWGLVSLLTFYLATSTAGRLIGGAVGMVGQGLAAAGQAAGEAAPGLAGAAQEELQQRGITLENIQQRARELLQQATQPQQGQTGQQPAVQGAANADEAVQQLEGLLATLQSDGGLQPADRDAVVDIIVEETGVERAQAEQAVSRWEQQYQQGGQPAAGPTEQAEQTARQASQQAAEALATASFWAAIALLLGAIAAVVGGMLGTPATHAIETERKAT